MTIVSKDIAAAFKDKRVFVTGHTGFKGSWLTLLLHELGAKVAGYALAPEDSGLYRLLGIGTLLTRPHTADIRDLKALTDAMHDFVPDVVFHLAAQPVVLTALENPVDTFSTNVMGTVHVLEALRGVSGKTAVVIVSSDKCYKNQETATPYVETDMLGGSDPYTASKACTEIVTAAYRESYFSSGEVFVASARAGNVLGGGDFGTHRLVPDLYRAIRDNQPLTLRYPGAIRPWQYVLDVLWGYITLAGSLMLGGHAFASEYNFANPSSGAVTVGDIVSRTLSLWGRENHPVTIEKARHKETHALLIDPAKAVRMLGWNSRMDNEAMMKETAGWYHKLLKKDLDLKEYTLAHIHDYLTKVTNP